MSDEIERPDRVGAYQRLETIREGMRGFANAWDAMADAYEHRDWVTLGYPDWDTYCEKEFTERKLKLKGEARERAVLSLRNAGMSIRAIGSALGVSTGAVHGDLTGVQERTPAAITGADGKTYPAAKPASEPPPAAQAEPGDTETEPEADGPEAPMDPSPIEGLIEESGRESAEEETPLPADSRSEGKPAKEKLPVWQDDDPEVVEAHRRRRISRSFAEGVAYVWSALDPDPIAWLSRSWDPSANPFSGMESMTKVLAPAGLRRTAEHLVALADHLDEKGETL